MQAIDAYRSVQWPRDEGGVETWQTAAIIGTMDFDFVADCRSGTAYRNYPRPIDNHCRIVRPLRSPSDKQFIRSP